MTRNHTPSCCDSCLGTFHGGSNPDCTCHQPPTAPKSDGEILLAFDRRFPLPNKADVGEFAFGVELDKRANLKSFLTSLLHTREQAMAQDVTELVDALESMYDQYCQNGHLFMSAGESAEMVLQKYGFSFDGGGRIEKRPYALSQITSKEV